ncbi:MAG: transposase [Candidatus Eremiobacterota bacterium]
MRGSVLTSWVKRLTPETARRMSEWPLERSGFNVHVGPVVEGHDQGRLRELVRYVLRAPFSVKRLEYAEESGEVGYLVSRLVRQPVGNVRQGRKPEEEPLRLPTLAVAGRRGC